jgi:hypothetical protein
VTVPADADYSEVRRLAARVDELTAHLARLTSDVEDLACALLPTDLTIPDDGAPDAGPATPESNAPAEAVKPVYLRLEDWVDQYFLPTFRRPIGGEIRWCTHWQEHPEAITRLEALWRSWETLRLDPNLGIAIWLTNYLDPLLATLLSRSAAFAQCTPDRHSA